MAITLTPVRIYQGTLGTSDALLYTVPSSTATLVRNILACNSNASSRTFRLHFVTAAGSSTTTNAICYDQNLTTGATDLQDILQVIPTGAMIRGLASATSSVGVNISGVEITGTYDKITPLRLCAPTMLTTSSALLYTVPASTKAVVKDIIVANVTGGAQTFRFDVVKSGQAVSSSTQLYNAQSVAANSNYHTRLTACMETGDMLYAQASANSSLAIHVTGVQIV